MPRPLPALNLRADLRPVAEGKHHPAVRIDRRILHKPVEQLLVEIHRQFHRFAKPRNETAENIILDFLPLPFLLQVVLPALQGGVPAGVPVILFTVIVLVKFPYGVLIDQLLDQSRHHFFLPADRFQLRLNGAAVDQNIHDRPAVPDDLLPVFYQDAECLKEQLLYPLLVQVGRGTPAFPFELGVALPDCPPVLAVGVPHLGAEVFSAVPAFQLCGEHAAAVMAPPRVLPPLYLRLHELPFCRLDDGVVAALHIILRHFPFVRLCHLSRGRVHQINTASGRVAPQIHAVQNSLMHLQNVLFYSNPILLLHLLDIGFMIESVGDCYAT